MAVREVLIIPDPTLYKVSEPVTEFGKGIRPLVRDLFDTMEAAMGVGLAGVQIGVLKRILVLNLVEQGFIKGTFINPRVIEKSDEIQNGEEGCLSVPGLTANLDRPKWVKIAYQNISGEEMTIEGEMLLARALLHEMDHLDGKVFVDLLEPDLRLSLNDDIDRIEHGELPLEPVTPNYRQ